MKYLIPFLLATFCGHLFLPSIAFAQLVVLDIGQRPNSEGVLEYEIEGFSDLIAPDGTVLNGFGTEVEGLSFEELESRFFGDWTVSSSDATFSLSFGLDDVFSEVPFFVSPAGVGNSATVSGSSFLLDWEYPSGFNDFSGLSVSGSGPFGLDSDPFDSDFTSVNVVQDFNLGLPFDPLPPLDIPAISGPLEFQVTVGNSTRVDELITLPEGSDITPLLRFTTFSPEFTVTVVPEPSTGGIVSFAFLALAGLRRRT